MADSISNADRNQWLKVLQAAAESEPDAVNDLWCWLMVELGIPLEHFHEVFVAVAEGRWRNARNPKAYVKTVARRLAKKSRAKAASDDQALVPLGDGPCDRYEFSFEEAIDASRVRSSAQPSKHADGIWRRGEGDYEDEPYDDEGRRLSNLTFRQRMLGHVPMDLTRLVPPSEQLQAEIDRVNQLLTDDHLHLSSRFEVRWERWAKEAGLDRWECEVLQCKLRQVSRDRALACQANEERRKELQAAWRRFDRTCLRKLRETAKKNLPKNVPE